ncbi:hypothetical protein F8178_19615 [Haloechinothrix sp. LS1_15]|nr:hypothetical protein [Haloechinothrix sp. LS1_15]
MAQLLRLLDEHAELNHRYRKLITESLRTLEAERIRLTQARGIAKRLIVLVRAAGPELRSRLNEQESQVVDRGLAQANELTYEVDAPAGNADVRLDPGDR